MGLFGSLFGKKSKPNLTPDISMPTQEQLYFTSGDAEKGGYSLRDFAARGIKGEGLGFGEDYLSKTTNPAIAQIDANFKNRTLPTISNEASKRGLARSSIVTDQIGQADLQRGRDISSMVADFYNLNEMQKKTDQSQALGLAGQLQNQQQAMKTNQAMASERLNERTANQQNVRNAESAGMWDNIGAGIGTLIGGPVGGMMGGGGGGGIASALSSFGFGNMGAGGSNAMQVGRAGALSQNPVRTQTLQSMNSNQLDQLIRAARGY